MPNFKWLRKETPSPPPSGTGKETPPPSPPPSNSGSNLAGLFDEEWFEELGCLGQPELEKVRPRPMQSRRLSQFSHDSELPLFSARFTDNLDRFLDRLARLGYRFGSHRSMRVQPGHMYTFPQGTAFRKQINISFSGLGSANTYGAGIRIGVGFHFGSSKPEGYDDWRDFLRLIEANPSRFNQAFASLGNYAEAHDRDRGWRNIFDGQSLSTTITNDLPNIQDGSWRCFGRFVRSPEENEILTSLDRIVSEVDRVFKTIASTRAITLSGPPR